MNKAPKRALHLGAMDWAPNHQGVSWFVQMTFGPWFISHPPEAQLLLGGSKHGPKWTPTMVWCPLLGEVDDAADTYDTPCGGGHPLHAGSGMRIKIAEALAAGRPIITTTKGMDRPPLEHEEHVMVANTAEDLQKRWSTAEGRRQSVDAMGQRGRTWAQVNICSTAPGANGSPRSSKLGWTREHLGHRFAGSVPPRKGDKLRLLPPTEAPVIQAHPDAVRPSRPRADRGATGSSSPARPAHPRAVHPTLSGSCGA